MIVELDIRANVIGGARYTSNGCPGARMAIRTLAEFVIGRTIDQASRLEPTDLLVIGGELPEGQGHQYARAVEALQSALKEIQ
jgi:NifU-like protein involved in Fe-S cluster formation